MDELDRLDRERRDADARYNEALTALDRAVVASGRRDGPPLDFERTATALLTFLQQITGFVESKDRQLAADAARRIDALAPALEAIGELRVKVALLERAVRATREVISPQSSVVSPQSSVVSPQSSVSHRPSAIGHDDEHKYVGFEDQFRGAGATIEERLRVHVPIFAGRSNVLDIGCGRGELLSALRDAGITARGIDTNSQMVAIAGERGLDALHGDALAHLSTLPDGSLGGIIATQVIEHLEPGYLLRLIDEAGRTLEQGAPIVLETINPACWLAFFSSYLRDLTHVQPIHPDTLQYLLRASAFARVEIRYSAPVPEHVKMKTIDLPAAVLGASDPASQALLQLAHTVNANAVILNNLMFTHLDYAAIAYKS
jgi:SAM-dependent methyltransferase